MTLGNGLKVRMLSPWSTQIETENTVFSAEIPASVADAMLCVWSPAEEMFSFEGPRAWYCCEPECQFELMEHGRWIDYRSRLRPSEFLFHNHSSINYRVPHITHFEEILVRMDENRIERAVSVVSNFGGGPRGRHPHIAYRNRFVTHRFVDLFGRRAWKNYREGFISMRRPPNNYQGEISGDWPAKEKRDLLSKYKVCVCLENMHEPNYFTEKFVEAVAAGCIPIYRAHDSLRDTVLQGAKWVDPADYGDDPDKTIQAALEMDDGDFRVGNTQWLKSEGLKATHISQVFERIGNILRYEATGPKCT
jgi:hypothetical protein